MTPEEQRAPKAFMKVYFDGRKELSIERPEESPDAGIVELLDRGMLEHYLKRAESAEERCADVMSTLEYQRARDFRNAAEHEARRLDTLIGMLQERRDELERGLKSS